MDVPECCLLVASPLDSNSTVNVEGRVSNHCGCRPFTPRQRLIIICLFGFKELSNASSSPGEAQHVVISIDDQLEKSSQESDTCHWLAPGLHLGRHTGWHPGRAIGADLFIEWCDGFGGLRTFVVASNDDVIFTLSNGSSGDPLLIRRRANGICTGFDVYNRKAIVGVSDFIGRQWLGDSTSPFVD